MILDRIRSRLLRESAVLAGGTVLGSGLIILVSPLLTRLYSPADFGALGVYASLQSLLLVVACLRYELAIPLPADDATAANVVAAALLGPALLVLPVAAAVWVAGGRLAAWLGAPGLEDYLWLLPIGLAGGGVYQALSYAALRKKESSVLARTRITQSVGTAATQLALGVFHAGLLGLLLGDLVGRISGVQVLARSCRRWYRREWLSLPATAGAARRYVLFPLMNSGAALLTALSTQAPILLLSAGFGPVIAGYFALTMRVLSTPTSLVGQAVGQAFFAEAASLNGKRREMSLLTERTATLMLSGGLLVFGVVALDGPELFTAVFGSRWRTAGTYSQLLAPLFLFRLVLAPLSSLLTIREWQGTTLLYAALECVVQIGAAAVGVLYHSEFLAVALLGWGGCLLTLITMGRFFRAGYASQADFFRRALPMLICATLAAVAVFTLITGTSPAAVALRLSLFTVAYALAVWWFRPLRGFNAE